LGDLPDFGALLFFGPFGPFGLFGPFGAFGALVFFRAFLVGAVVGAVVGTGEGPSEGISEGHGVGAGLLMGIRVALGASVRLPSKRSSVVVTDEVSDANGVGSVVTPGPVTVEGGAELDGGAEIDGPTDGNPEVVGLAVMDGGDDSFWVIPVGTAEGPTIPEGGAEVDGAVEVDGAAEGGAEVVGLAVTDGADEGVSDVVDTFTGERSAEVDGAEEGVGLLQKSATLPKVSQAVVLIQSMLLLVRAYTPGTFGWAHPAPHDTTPTWMSLKVPSPW